MKIINLYPACQKDERQMAAKAAPLAALDLRSAEEVRSYLRFQFFGVTLNMFACCAMTIISAAVGGYYDLGHLAMFVIMYLYFTAMISVLLKIRAERELAKSGSEEQVSNTSVLCLVATCVALCSMAVAFFLVRPQWQDLAIIVGVPMYAFLGSMWLLKYWDVEREKELKAAGQKEALDNV